MTLKPFAHASRFGFGPLEFFRRGREILTRKAHMSQLTWADWGDYFALAQELVLVGTADARGQYYPVYPVLANALLKTWRSARAAQAGGWSVWQWYQSEDHRLRLMAEEDARKKREMEDQIRERRQRDDEANAAKVGHKLGGERRASV